MYQLRGRLGRWGFGEIYEAVQSDTGAHRMLKVVRGRRASDAHIHAHMSHEYEVASCCAHPHIVAIETMEEDPALGIYHVMDLVRGETLGAAMKRGLTFSPKKVLEIIGAATSALTLLEAKGHAHNEFCPETLYLPAQGPSPWVISFGLPPAASSHPPLPLEALAYAAPERKAAQVWDNRADVYSVCAVMLQLLVGRPPPPQGWIQFPKPALDSELSEGLYELARRGLNAAPGQRFPSMEALFGALKFLADSQGVRLVPPESQGEPKRPPRPAPKRTVLGISALTPPGQPVSSSGPAVGAPPPPPAAVMPREPRPPKGVKVPTRPKIPAGRAGRPGRGGMKKTVLGIGALSESMVASDGGGEGAGLGGDLNAPAAAPPSPAPASQGFREEVGSAAEDSLSSSWNSGFEPSDLGSRPLDDLAMEPPSSAPLSFADVRGGTPLDELSLPGDVTGVGGDAPLAPEAFPGGDTEAQGQFDPSQVSELPLPGRAGRRLPLWGLIAGAVVGLAVVGLVLAFVWPGFAKRKRGSGQKEASSSGQEGVASREKPRGMGRRDGGVGPRHAPGPAGSGKDAGLGTEARPAARDAGVAARPDAGGARPSPDAAVSTGTDARAQPASRYKLALSEGRKALRHHKYRLARRFFTKAHHLRPRSSTPMRLMARAHYREHQYMAARYWYEEALKVSPRSASLHERLGKVYAKLGKRSKACRYFVKALSLRPNSRRYRMEVQNYRCGH